MKRNLTLISVLLFFLVACGGTNEPTVNNNQENETTINTDNSDVDNPSPTAVEEDSSPEEGEESNNDDTTSGDVESDETETTGNDENGIDDTGLTVNPDPVIPGEPFIIEGVIVNASMIPTDAPQFMIEADNGVRYRLNSQPADEIFTNLGTQLQPYEFGPGVRVRATALLPVDATAADVASTTDLVVILEE